MVVFKFPMESQDSWKCQGQGGEHIGVKKAVA